MFPRLAFPIFSMDIFIKKKKLFEMIRFTMIPVAWQLRPGEIA